MTVVMDIIDIISWRLIGIKPFDVTDLEMTGQIDEESIFYVRERHQLLFVRSFHPSPSLEYTYDKLSTYTIIYCN